MSIPQVSHNTYADFKNATLGHAYDIDGYPSSQPYQCWDYVDLLYQQDDVGQLLYTAATVGQGDGTAKSCWLNGNARALNGAGHFQLVYNKEEIKQGDIIVFNTYSGWYSDAGHIGFADEDYNGTDTIRLLSQNFYGHHYVVLEDAYLGDAFLGVFRFKQWHHQPQPTPTDWSKKKFPWPIAWRHWWP